MNMRSRFELFWSGETKSSLKTLFYIFCMVGTWNIVESCEWGIYYVIKQTLIIWFVGTVSYYMANRLK